FERLAPSLAEAGLDPAHVEIGDLALDVAGRARRYAVQRTVLDAPGADGEADGGAGAVAVVFEPLLDAQILRTNALEAIARLDDYARLVSDWIWETNRNLVLTFVSARVSEALDFHPVELTGRPLGDLVRGVPELFERLPTPEGRRPFRDVEVEVVDRRGQVRQFLLSGLPVYNNAGGDFAGFRGTAHDVTERKWREAAMIAAKENAELANRAKGEFLANMSHELRTPLNAIIGFAEIMADEMYAPLGDPRYREYVGDIGFSEIMTNEICGPLGSAQYKGYVVDISDSARHLLAMINDILDAAKIESGHMSLGESMVAPGALLSSVRRLIAPRAELAGVNLSIEASDDLPRLRADSTKLKQILINLVSNAVKFTGRNGRVEMRAQMGDAGEFLFMVSDTGIGMEPDDIPRALAPFGQVDSRVSRKFEGTGLGLPLAKSLTELHDGSFDLVSQPGVGTTVTVRLPATRVVRD
ncbi:MAG: PAS domain-containing sensor histidine kinase, partial [Kiloniellaceae bacterium]